MSTSTAPPTSTTPNLIACLESYLCPSLPIGTILADQSSPALHILPSPTVTKLKNLGPARAKDMRTLGHARQIISHIPLTVNPALCTKFNDALNAGVRLDADKMAAIALLPCGKGEGLDAAKELQRCVKLGFVGGMVVLRREGIECLLDESYKELWSAAERWRVPILLREAWPTGDEVYLNNSHSIPPHFISVEQESSCWAPETD